MYSIQCTLYILSFEIIDVLSLNYQNNQVKKNVSSSVAKLKDTTFILKTKASKIKVREVEIGNFVYYNSLS